MFGKKKIQLRQQGNFYEDLEDRLVEADISPRIAYEISDEMRKLSFKTPEERRESIRTELQGMVYASQLLPPPAGETGCWLFLGVNGVGKTTSLVKLAEYWKKQGHSITLAAGDTFRAAAVEQLEIHAKRLDIRCIRQKQGGDPGAVIYDAIESAQSRKGGLVMADSAGRMHTKSQLIKELQKIDRIIRSKTDAKHYKKILVIDATTGQNGLQQAETFHEALGIDGIILSKYDSRARGGLALSISRQLKLPFIFLGTGEKYGDIIPFDPALIIDRIMEDLK